MKTLRPEIDERARLRVSSQLAPLLFRPGDEWVTGGSAPLLQ